MPHTTTPSTFAARHFTLNFPSGDCTRRQLLAACLVAGGFMAGAPRLGAYQAQPVQEPDFGAVLWRQAIKDTFVGEARVRAFVLLDYAVSWRQAHPNSEATELVEAISRFDAVLPQPSDANELGDVRSSFEKLMHYLGRSTDHLSDEASLPLQHQAIGHVGRHFSSAYFANWIDTLPYSTSMLQYNYRLLDEDPEAEFLNTVYLAARSDADLAHAIDATLTIPPSFNLAHLNGPTQYLAALQALLGPSVDFPPVAIDDTGTLRVAITDAQSHVEKQIADLSAQIDTGIAELRAADQAHPSLYAAAIGSSETNTEANKEAARRLAERQKPLNDAEKAIGYLAKLVEQEDPSAAKQFKAVATGFITTVKSINEYASKLETATRFGATVGAAVLTGNVVLAVMGVISAFSSSHPNQAVIRQLGQLREQITDLSTTMDTRFNRVDLALTEISDDLARNTALVEENIQLTLAVLGSLSFLEDRLGTFEMNLENFIAVGNRQELFTEINEAINYEENFEEALEEDLFRSSTALFYSWATQYAWEGAELGPEVSSFDDQFAATYLQTPIENRVNYLNKWLAANDYPTFFRASDPLPNPRTWVTAAWSYALLLLENPDQIEPSHRIARMITGGHTVRQAFRSITAPPVLSESADAPRILQVVAAHYADAITNLFAELADREQTLSDSALQQLAVEPATLKAPHRKGNLEFALPNDVYKFILPSFIKGANLSAGLGGADGLELANVPEGPRFTVIIDHGWSRPDHIKTYHVPNTFPTMTFDEHIYESTPWVGFQIRFDGTRVLSAGVSLPDEKVMHCVHKPDRGLSRCLKNGAVMMEAPDRDDDSWLTVGRWNKALAIMQGFDQEEWDRRLEIQLDGLRKIQELRAYARRVGQEVERTVDHAVLTKITGELSGDVRSELVSPAADRLTGAKSLLGAFIALGAPRAYCELDSIRSLLMGSEALLDRDAVLIGYSVDPASHKTAIVRNELHALAKQRAETMQQVIDELIATIDAEDFDPTHPLVETTLDVLTVASQR